MFRSTHGSRRFRHRSLFARKLRFESLESKFLLDAHGLVLSLDQCGSYASVNDNSAFDLGMNDGEDFTIGRGKGDILLC
jgi:hypothetical protein